MSNWMTRAARLEDWDVNWKSENGDLVDRIRKNDERLWAGLNYYMGEYEDMVHGTRYDRVAREESVPMQVKPISENVMQIFVTLYFGIEGGGQIIDDINKKVIRPSGWKVEMTYFENDGRWVECEGGKYSVIRFDIERV